jgi:uracil-DNA glycosylase
MPSMPTERDVSIKTMAPQLHASWMAALGDEFEKPHMMNLREFLKAEYLHGATVFPPKNEYFSALNITPLNQVRVVILGQDPYHGAGQAHGLCFSVRQGIALPPSLLNIYKELESDLGVPRAENGCLEKWAEQGVLLLNSVLTVRENQAASHQGRGWELFTDRVIREVAEQRNGVAFVLWGAHAQKKAAFVDRKKHLVLASAHPSPLSAHRGFFGSRPFSKINAYLEAQGQAPISWRLV